MLIYYKTWIYQCLIKQVKSPRIYMVSRPGLGSDPPIGSDRESGRDITLQAYKDLLDLESCVCLH